MSYEDQCSRHDCPLPSYMNGLCQHHYRVSVSKQFPLKRVTTPEPASFHAESPEFDEALHEALGSWTGE